MCACVPSRFSHVWLFVTLWTVIHQVPLSVGFSRQEYWSGCHALFQGIFPTQGLNSHLLCLLHCKWILLPTGNSLPGKSHVLYLGRASITYLLQKPILFSKTKQSLMRRMALFYLFANLFNIWFHGRYLDSLICSVLKSVVIFFFWLKCVNKISHKGVIGKGRGL